MSWIYLMQWRRGLRRLYKDSCQYETDDDDNANQSVMSISVIVLHDDDEDVAQITREGIFSSYAKLNNRVAALTALTRI